MRGLEAACCFWKGLRDGEEAGKQAWIETSATEIRAASPRLTVEQAKAEARSDLTRLERNLDGWG